MSSDPDRVARRARSAARGRRAPRQPDFVLTPDELREVTTFALASAVEALPHYELACPGETAPRQAIDAARAFVDGAWRSKLQRITGPAAHRAAREAPTAVAHHAAMAAGDAAASVYLHPLADAAQVGHILRSSAHAGRVQSLTNPQNPNAATDSLQKACRRATPLLASVLGRYPTSPPGSNPVGLLMHQLDEMIRALHRGEDTITGAINGPDAEDDR